MTIELTARQVHHIYQTLPLPDKWISDKGINSAYVVALDDNLFDSFSYKNQVFDNDPIAIRFEIDTHAQPYEWKPCIDIIIKS